MAKETKLTEKTEREYVIPLRCEWKKVPRYKRAKKAIRAIREFLVQHMKIRDRDLNKIKIDKYLNEEVWFRGIKKPPAKIKVKAIKEEDIVRVELVDYSEKAKFKKTREEKILKEGEEKAKKKKEEKKIEEKKPEETAETTSEEKAPKGVHQGGASTSTRPSSEEKKNLTKKGKEVAEKKAAVIDAGEKIAEQQHKKIKHQTSGKSKQPKHQQRKALAK